MFEFLFQHQFWTAVVLYWIFSAAVSSMPEPPSNGSAVYLWFFRFCHTTAGNIATALSTAARYRASVGNKITGLTILVPVLLIPLLLVSTTACAAHYTVHPGALNKADSAAYDTLLIAEKAIDKARSDYKNQQLPPETKAPLNALIQVYNAARESWLTYRGAVATKIPSDVYFNQLTKNISDLIDAIRAFNAKELR